MNKTQEALKLALEALEYYDKPRAEYNAKTARAQDLKAIAAIHSALAEQPAQQCNHCNGSGRMVRDPDIGTDQECFVCEGVGFIKPEQPAQQQEQYIGETNVELGFYSDDASNGQQRELVGKVEMGQLVGNRPHESTSNPDAEREIAVITGVDEYGPMLGWFKHWINYPVGTKLYTSPQPAQQQEPVAWIPIEQMYPQAKAIDILMGDGSILCAVLPQFDGDLWWDGSGTGEKFIDPKYANVTHWRIHDERTSPPAERKLEDKPLAPRKPWVGLTDEDKQIAFDDTQEGGGFWEFADAIEATLRKKNHG